MLALVVIALLFLVALLVAILIGNQQQRNLIIRCLQELLGQGSSGAAKA
ncbi:MAG: hypothetical protein LPK26_14215 [Bacillaceae bacterium]|nr:hypothetical protein [Bacillaceae bacterium]